MFSLLPALSPAQSLTLRLYDYSGLTATEAKRLTEVTRVALGHAGIDVIWLHCRGVLAQLSGCAGEMNAHEVIVRLHPRVPARSNSRPEGLAVTTLTREGGHYVTVYVPAVRALAVRLELAVDLVLGYAVAHEAVHCLLGPGHSLAGLMRATWTRKDAQEIARLSLGLSKPEALKARSQLAIKRSHQKEILK